MSLQQTGTQFDPDELPPDAIEDKELTLAFQRGDDGAYQAIYERYSGRVHAVCRRMLGDPDDAQEAAQEAFLRSYQALARFNGRYQLGAWITRIATNVCLDHLRARSRRPSDATALEELELHDFAHNVDATPEAVVIRNSEGRRVRKVLAGLPPMHRAAIVLRDFEGLSYEEVSVALGITDTQVKALIHRARQGFKRSWSSVIVSALVPTRLLQRLRRVEASSSNHAGNASSVPPQAAEMASSTAQFASQCSAILQQCGQLVAERLAPAMTAVLVGTAALGTAAASSSERAPSPSEGKRIVQARTAKVEVKRHVLRKKTEADAVATQPDEPAEPAAAPPPEQPAPKPEPSPTDSGGGQGRNGESPPPPAEPTGFSLLFDAAIAQDEPCSCVKPVAVIAESVVAGEKEGMRSFSHELEGTATVAGASIYGLWLSHSSTDVSHHDLNFRLSTAQGSYGYTATGDLQSVQRTSWGGWVYRYYGPYHLTVRPSRTETVPEAGFYSLELTISGRTGSVISTSFYLTETG